MLFACKPPLEKAFECDKQLRETFEALLRDTMPDVSKNAEKYLAQLNNIQLVEGAETYKASIEEYFKFEIESASLYSQRLAMQKKANACYNASLGGEHALASDTVIVAESDSVRNSLEAESQEIYEQINQLMDKHDGKMFELREKIVKAQEEFGKKYKVEFKPIDTDFDMEGC